MTEFFSRQHERDSIGERGGDVHREVFARVSDCRVPFRIVFLERNENAALKRGGTPAAMSDARSPTIHECARSSFIRSPAATIIPGFGLRQG